MMGTTVTTERTYSIVAVEGMDGAGKSTLIRSLHDALAERCRVLLSRPSRQMALVFRELVERTGDDSVLYQHVLPAAFRQAAYIFEASVQFQYLHETYSAHDVVLFDRWQQTWEVYCEPVDEYVEQFRALRDRIPSPDLLFYLRVEPELAYDRLVARADRWCRTYSPAELRAKLAGLYARYEEHMRDADVIVLDAAAPPDEVLKNALHVVEQRRPWTRR
jgi:thymidylate kinase